MSLVELFPTSLDSKENSHGKVAFVVKTLVMSEDGLLSASDNSDRKSWEIHHARI